MVRSKYVRVKETPAEIEAFRKNTKSGAGRPTTYRYACRDCGKRLWGSGLGFASHTRACKERKK